MRFLIYMLIMLLGAACSVQQQAKIESETSTTDIPQSASGKPAQPTLGAGEATPSADKQKSIADISSIAQGEVTKNAQLKPRTEEDVPLESFAAAVQPAPKPAAKAERKLLATPMIPPVRHANEPVDRENYAHFENNSVMRVAEHPVSTFSVDVDTGSYTNVRRMLNAGHLPVKNAVRAEEFINYFEYQYTQPQSRDVPFSVTTEIGPTPWNTNTHLLHIGIQGYAVPREQLADANLVFLVDVSGSMQSPDKLELLKNALRLLTNQLRDQDKVSLVVYAGASGVVLQPTSGAQRALIMQAIDNLTAGGSTNGAAGIRLAYQMAQQAFIAEGINRVILATDGDFNVGTVNFEALKDLIEQQRKTGVYLTTLGFGTGNYNDHLMEQLADAGNGNYAYIDTLKEAQKVLVNQMGATLNTIAKDVKIQIEFNPQWVREYRLVGYENRALKREDFNNDKVDAGDIGAGHSVTAIYEIALVGEQGERVDALRYQTASESMQESLKDELAFLKLRYKHPSKDNSKLITQALKRGMIKRELQSMSNNYRFAAGVAAFAQLLRGATYTNTFNFDNVVALTDQAKGADQFGYRSEFVQLVRLAKNLTPAPQRAAKMD